MAELCIPETKVLTIASHVGLVDLVSRADMTDIQRQGCLWVSILIESYEGAERLHPVLLKSIEYLTIPRHVGNTMAAFVMQALGCEVAALNTVQFSMGFLPIICG